MDIDKAASTFVLQGNNLSRMVVAANRNDMFEVTILSNQIDETRRALDRLSNEVDLKLAQLKQKARQI